MRLSPSFGMRNFLNTAFVPIGFDDDNATKPRLLVTIDSGQPYEIDPTTLELVGPIGSLDQWYPDGGSFWPFPLLFTCAHPVWDPRTKEGFFVNWGKGIADFVDSVPLAYDAQVMCEQVGWSVSKFWDALNLSGVNVARKYVRSTLKRAQNWVRVNTPQALQGIWPQQFTYLLRWDGESALTRWNLVDENGAAVNIEGSVHQIAVTEKYVILLDCAFDIGINTLLEDPFPNHQTLERLLRNLTARPIQNESVFTIVSRADLRRTPGVVPGSGQRDVNLKCHQVRVPMGACHFLADYGNPDNQITLHVAHNTATDVSEWVADYDTSLYGKQNLPADILGVFPAPMDVSRLGLYVFDGEDGTCLASDTTAQNPQFWSVALYAGQNQFTPFPQINAVGSLYWNTTGFFPEQATRFAFDLYANYPDRVTPNSVLRELNGSGIPSTLFRTHVRGLGVADSFTFPDGIVCGSPQFIEKRMQALPPPAGDPPPARQSEAPPPVDHSQDEQPRYKGGPIPNPQAKNIPGFIATMVYTPDGTEVWIFDAEHLHQGPLCKLASENLKMGFTAHSWWLDLLGPGGSRQVNVVADLEPRLKGRGKQVKKVFYDSVFPNWE